MYSEEGTAYIDFLSGAGALNYGHNNEYIKKKIINYLAADGPMHALYLHTVAKRTFLETFTGMVLEPRGLDYKVQFCGPTGTNAVEAALKLARKVKKRTGAFAFMGGYHGVSLGSLALTTDPQLRASAGVPLNHVSFMPFPYGRMSSLDSIDFIDTVLNDPCSGIEAPAAIVFETLQGEGGVVAAPISWMQRLRRLCDHHGILLICDEIQTGAWRTGPYFSFERAGIVPDMVMLAKSVSGYGLPMALVLIRPEYDIWAPGDHNGTFRGNQLAFVGATGAIELAIASNIEAAVAQKGSFMESFLTEQMARYSPAIIVRGLGMFWGIDFSQCGGAETTRNIVARCLDRGLVIERTGRNRAVVKVMPALTISQDTLEEGCSILGMAVEDVLSRDSVINVHADTASRVLVSGES
jgi:diaminobutyrate-2-oxoglutarate transaminase